MQIKKTIGAIIAAVCVLVLGFSLVFCATKFEYSSPTSSPSETSTKTYTVSVTIDSAFVNRTMDVSDGETVFRILQNISKNDSAMQLATKEYAGMGVLITSMYGKTNGENKKYWQYSVNGTMPQISADKFVPHAGDAIEWQFSESKE